MKASANPAEKRVFVFDSFVLDENEKALLRNGERVPLTPKAVEMLIVLVANAGMLLEKEDLMQRIWPDTFVEEANLAVNISMLRKALGEMPGGGQYIGTLPRRGYRFAAEVSSSVSAPEKPEQSESARIEPVLAQSPIDDCGASGDLTYGANTPKISGAGLSSFTARPGSRPLAIALISSVVIAGATLAYLAVSRKSGDPGRGQIRRLAVLPFRNLRPTDDTDYLGFALADSVINSLDHLKALVVRPSSYVEKYVNSRKTPQEIATELDVDTLLTASYVKDGEYLIVYPDLSDVASTDSLWKESITVKSDKLVELQEIVARQVVTGLRLNLSDAEGKRLHRNAAIDPVAFEYHLRSRYLLSTNNHQKAIEYLEQAVELDPNFALAWAYLGRAYHINALQFSGNRSELSKAEADYEQALALDPDFSQARLMMAKLFTETGRVEQAAPLLIDLVKANPNMAEAHWELSYAYRYGGLLDESIAEGEKALELNTRLESHQFNSYLYTGQYQRFLASLPVREDGYVVFYRGIAQYYLGDLSSAAAAFDRAYELNPGSVISQIGKALQLAIAGKNREGLQILNAAQARIVKAGTGDGEITYKFAQVYDALGDKQSALRALDLSVQQGFFCYQYFAKDPLLKTIRDEPEFARILEKARQRQYALKITLQAN